MQAGSTDRRLWTRSKVSERIRIRPINPRHPEKICTAANQSKNGFYFMTSSGYFVVGMDVFVTRNFQPKSPVNHEDNGAVVRVESLGGGNFGVAIKILANHGRASVVDPLDNLAMDVHTEATAHVSSPLANHVKSFESDLLTNFARDSRTDALSHTLKTGAISFGRTAFAMNAVFCAFGIGLGIAATDSRLAILCFSATAVAVLTAVFLFNEITGLDQKWRISITAITILILLFAVWEGDTWAVKKTEEKSVKVMAQIATDSVFNSFTGAHAINSSVAASPQGQLLQATLVPKSLQQRFSRIHLDHLQTLPETEATAQADDHWAVNIYALNNGSEPVTKLAIAYRFQMLPLTDPHVQDKIFSNLQTETNGTLRNHEIAVGKPFVFTSIAPTFTRDDIHDMTAHTKLLFLLVLLQYEDKYGPHETELCGYYLLRPSDFSLCNEHNRE
jgi:hypothetical protein